MARYLRRWHGSTAARRKCWLARRAREYLVLAKYPVLVVLAGAGPSVRAGLVGLLLYAVLAAHEWQDATT